MSVLQKDETMGDQEQMERRKPGIYFLFAFGLTWACWISAIFLAESNGFQLPSPVSITPPAAAGTVSVQQALASFLFRIAVYGPLLGAFAATLLETGRQGAADLIRRITKWRVPARWYLVVLVIPLLISLVPKLIGVVSGMDSGSFFAVSSVTVILVLFVRQILTSGIGEEPGWRGYLQPYLQSRFSVDKSIWILGVIWAVWHYPITIYYTLASITAAPMPAVVITILMSLAGQTISLVGMTYIYAWVYNNTKSVFLAILFHALSNLLPAVLLGESSQLLGTLTAVMPWVVVFALEKIYGKDSFEGK